MRGLFNKTLGASLSAPFVPKCNPIAAAAISAGGALLGGLMSAGSSANLNAANRNYDMHKTHELMDYNSNEAALARKHQENLLKKEQDWNEYYYNMYNSPSAMRAQLEEAGYHPYLGADSQPNVGSVPSVSAPSGASASAPNTGNPSTYLPDSASPMRGLIDSANLLLTGKRVNAESANQQAQALSNIADLIPKLHTIGMSDDDIRKVVEPFLMSSQGINADNDLVFKTAKTKYLTDESNRKRQELELDLANRFSAKERSSMLNQIDQSITESVAKIGLMASEAKLNDKECEHLAQDIVESVSRIYRNYAEGSKSDIEGYQLMEFQPYVETELKRSANKAELEDSETFNNSYIRRLDKTVTGKVINTIIWYLGRAFSSANAGVNVSAKVPTGK